MPRLLLACCFMLLALTCYLVASPASLRLKGVSLAEALTQLQKQTGPLVVSEFDHPGTVDLDLREATPWQALDALAAQVKGDVLPPLDGRRLRLVSRVPGSKAVPSSYHGAFRFRLLRVSASRDLASGEGETSLGLEVAWLPSARPLFLDELPEMGRVLDGAGKPVALPERFGNMTSVEGRFVFPLEVKLPTVPKGGKLSVVEGKLNAVMPTELLTFRFPADLDALANAKPGGEQRQSTVKGVTCRIENITVARDRWTVRAALDYPEGNKILESFQAGSMVAFNEMRLEKGKKILRPTASVANVIGSRRTVVTFHFTEDMMAPRGGPADWKLQYTAPALIVDVPLRFAFKDVPLP